MDQGRNSCRGEALASMEIRIGRRRKSMQQTIMFEQGYRTWSADSGPERDRSGFEGMALYKDRLEISE